MMSHLSAVSYICRLNSVAFNFDFYLCQIGNHSLLLQLDPYFNFSKRDPRMGALN